MDLEDFIKRKEAHHHVEMLEINITTWSTLKHVQIYENTSAITVHCAEKCIQQQELDSTETSSKLQGLFHRILDLHHRSCHYLVVI
jgi:hypothetical protein